MQPDESAFEESSGGHLVPSAVIGITDDKAGKDEEEIHREVAMRHRRSGEKLEHMVNYDDQGGDSSKSVKDVVMWSGIFEQHSHKYSISHRNLAINWDCGRGLES